MRVIPALAVPVWRTLPWRTLGAAGAAGLLTAGLSRLPGTEPDSRLALGLLRGAALAGALGLAFLLDDPARDGTTTVPTGRAARTALRVALVAPVAALWWAAALLLVPGAHRPPAGAVTLEAGTACALALAAATVAVRHSDDPRPGRPAATAVLVTALLAPLLLPSRWALFTGPEDPRWAAAHDRWAWLLAGAVTVGVASLGEPLGHPFRRTADQPT
ncbi:MULTISPECIES: ABC transporter [Streptomyces]|uniref:ABC transporter n=1 Tax=Streptomyces tricolor TaxID=68277 RepID=A0ABS9JF77_9ACTN|nr:ABC transporter [Streptomyces tricolor]MCG0064199.1 ABC transporter [Streptomyces tricolor]